MKKINAKELRIGNNIWWLHEEAEEVLTVDAEMISRIDDYNKNPDDDKYSRGMWWSAIPLTVELLESCGFKKWSAFDGCYISIGNGNFLMMRLYKSEWIAFICCINVKEELYSNPQKIIKNIPKLFHQLQNLYFALTGTELEIKL